MLSINDLKNGSLILVDGFPYQVLEVAHQHIGRGGSSIQTKIRNIKTGQLLLRNFKPADVFEKADVEKKPLKFLYHHQDDFVFVEPDQPSIRYTLNEGAVGDTHKWLKPNTQITALFFNDELYNITLPIKMELEVTEAPPGIQGDRSSSGSKSIILETGTTIQAPLFINPGDIVRINTETGEYVERVTKGK